MTTSSSPIAALKSQASKIVRQLKLFQWKEGQENLKFAVVMDDKIIQMTVTKDMIQRTSSDELKEMIFLYMKEETVQ